MWDWGNKIWNPPLCMAAMRPVMALDPHFSVLITTLLFHLGHAISFAAVAPRPIPNSGMANPIHLSVHPGGHRFLYQ